MDPKQIEERVQTIRREIARVVATGDDEEGLRLRSLLAELEHWEALRWATVRIAPAPQPTRHRPMH